MHAVPISVRSNANDQEHKINELDRQATAGFRNLGNTCYLNSVLQAFLGLDCFVRELKHPLFVDKAEKQGLFSSLLDAIQACESFFTSTNPQGRPTLYNNSNYRDAIDLSLVKGALGERRGTFAGDQQQDAHDLLVEVLSALEEELGSILKQIPVDSIMKQLHSSLMSNTNLTKYLKNEGKSKEQNSKIASLILPTNRSFYTQLTMTLTCTNDECKFSRNNTETSYFLCLDLDLPVPVFDSDPNHNPCPTKNSKKKNKNKKDYWRRTVTNINTVINQNQSQSSLSSLISLFFEEKILDYRCPKCSSTTVLVHTKFSSLPRVLILSLKRFETNFEKGCYEKRKDKIKIPTKMNLSSFCTMETEQPFRFSCDNTNNSSDRSHDLRPKLYRHRSRSPGKSKQSPRRVKSYSPTRNLNLNLNRKDETKIRDPYTVKTPTNKNSDLNDRKKQISIDRIDQIVTPIYYLQSIVHHAGDTASNGHYISYLLNQSQSQSDKERNWTCFDDALVTSVNEKEVLKKSQSEGYIYFFVHRELC